MPLRYVIPFYVQVPIIRMLIPFVAGIITAYYSEPPFWVTGILLSSLLVLFIPARKDLLRRYFGIAVLTAFVGLGMLATRLSQAKFTSNFVLKEYKTGDTILAIIDEPPVEKAKSFKITCRLLKITNNYKHALSGKAYIYVDKLNFNLDYGNAIIFTSPLNALQNSGNPGGFAYADQAARENVYLQGFLKSKDYKIVAAKFSNPVKKKIYAWRNYTLNCIKQFVPGAREAGLAEALLIGYRGDLDRDLTERYVNTGTVHIIAISGMHLGMLYALLLIIFKPLFVTRFRLTAIIATLLIIWAFVLATGAAPSITRAGIMFTAMLLGKSLQRKSNTTNSLAVAAFCLLLTDPLSVFNVGFQLSFAAVLSITIFYPWLSRMITPSNRYIIKIWQLTALTIAAQIITLPLVIYHFHQFPLSFLIANIIAVPLSGFALHALIFLIAFSFLEYIPMLTGKLIALCLRLMNKIVLYISGIEGLLIKDLNFDLIVVILSFILIAIFMQAIANNRRGNWNAFAGVAAFMLFYMQLQQFKFYRQQQLIIYHVPGASAIDIVEGRVAKFIGDSSLMADGFLRNFHLQPSRIINQYSVTNYQSAPGNENLRLTYYEKNILILQRPVSYKDSSSVSTDILLVTKNVAGNPARILLKIKPRSIVLDGTNSRYHQKRWMAVADSLHLPLHNTGLHGAFVLRRS